MISRGKASGKRPARVFPIPESGPACSEGLVITAKTQRHAVFNLEPTRLPLQGPEKAASLRMAMRISCRASVAEGLLKWPMFAFQV